MRIFVVISLWISANLSIGQVAEFPSGSLPELQVNINRLVDEGPQVVLRLAKNLQNTSEGNVDIYERYALSSLAKNIDRIAVDSVRIAFEQAFGEALRQGLPIETEVFLLEQMLHFATDVSVPILGEKISSLCEPAVHVLTQISTEPALSAMMEALKGFEGYCKLVLTKAIGKLSSTSAREVLISLSKEKDAGIRHVALRSLSNQGGPAVYQAIMQSPETPEQKCGFLLQWLRRPNNSDADVVSALDHIMSYGNASEKYGAILLMPALQGSGAQKKMLKLFTKGGEMEKLAIGDALAFSDNLSIAPFMKYFDRSTLDVQLSLLRAAIARNHKDIVPKCRTLLRSNSPDLQKGAIRTLSDLEGANSLVDLISVASTDTKPEMVRLSLAEMGQWINPANQIQIHQLLQNAPVSNKIEIVKFAAVRKWSWLWTSVEPFLQSPDKTLRQSAFEALPSLSDDLTINELVAFVPLAETNQELSKVQEAFKMRATQIGTDSLVDPLLKTYGNSSPRLLANIFPAIGGQKALEYLMEKGESSTLSTWQTPEVLPYLFERLLTQPDKQTHDAIFRLLSHRQLPHDQRVLYLRKLMPQCVSLEDKERVIRMLGGTSSISAFMYLKPFLDDPDLSIPASRSMIQLVLPSQYAKNGLYGQKIEKTISRADSILKSAEGYQYISPMLDYYYSIIPNDTGFISLFNGKDLTGWQGLVENPIARDTMFAIDLISKQDIADSLMHQTWEVNNGEIHFFGDGYNNLCTVDSYRDFELTLDWKITKKGDSGIYLRGSPQVQIWDYSAQDSTIGSGALFNNQIYANKPIAFADNPIGEWNTFRIIMIDQKVTVFLNGVLVTDNVILENFWNRSLPIFREGPIELQAHTTDLRFRDIYLRPLNGAPDLSKNENEAGFHQIFNGLNLDGWIGNKKDYVVENGEIILRPGDGGGNLYTEKEYDNFTLIFEFKLTPGANNGLGIHAPLEGDVAYLGKEIQILDDDAPIYANLQPYQYCGSIYGLAPARRGALKPVGEWNTQEVFVNGNQIRVYLNGQRIVNADLNILTRSGTLDGKEHPGLSRMKGHIGFLGHGSQVHFRNIRILEEITNEGEK